MPRPPFPTFSLARAASLVAAAVAAVVVCAAAAGGWASTATPAAGVETAASPRLAVLVLAPYLTFEDLSPSETPALWRLAEEGAVGAMNARTADRNQPNAASGALSISASRWASAAMGASATAADISALQAANDSVLTRPVLGALGSAVRGQGGITGSLSAGNTSAWNSAAVRRPAELAAMDTSGTADSSADRSGSMQQLSGDDGIRLVVVDSPALMFADESTTMTASQSRAAHRAAVAELDETVRHLRRGAPADTFWLIVAPATVEPPGEDPVMGPAIASGRGWSGTLTSPSTHRRGIITNLDVAPTLLDALGLKVPAVMVGSAVTAQPSALPLTTRLAALSAADRSAGALDRLRNVWFTHAFVALSLAACGLAVWAIGRRSRRDASAPTPIAEKIAAPLVLLVCALPPAAWLMLLLRPQPMSVAEAATALGVATAVVLAGLLGVRRLAGAHAADRPVRAALAAPFAASVLTTVIILAEQWLGAPMRAGLLSYSVRSGWRYYGMGNEGAALAVSASIVAVGLCAELLGDSPASHMVRRLALPIVGLAVLVTAAAPFAGANAGVAVWGVVAYGVAWAAMNRVRLTARVVAVIGLVVAVAIVAFAAIDLSSGVSGSTHLGRFVSGAVSGDVVSTGEMVGRKLANNLGYFVVTTYTLLFLGMGGIFVLLRRGSASGLRRAVAPLPALRAALLGVFAGGLMALVSEDSSSVMPALMWVVAIAPALVVALSLPTARQRAE